MSDEEFIIVCVHDREEDDLRHSFIDTFAKRGAIENKYNSDIIRSPLEQLIMLFNTGTKGGSIWHSHRCC